MGSKLINHTLSSITAGVSQQYQEGRFESQVDDMVNCMPSLTRGVIRRNPISDNKVLYKSGTSGETLDLANCFVYAYDRGTANEQYAIIIEPGTSYSTVYVYRLDDTVAPLPVASSGSSYLKLPAGSDPKESYEMITIGDYTFILNKTVKTSMGLTRAPGYAEYNNHAFYWIKKTTGVVVEQATTGDANNSTSGSKIEGYKYTLNGKPKQGLKITAPVAGYPVDRLKADAIAYDLSTDLNSPSYSGYAADTDSAFVTNKLLDIYGITEWDWEDTFGNQASLGVWKTVDSADKLPARLPSQLDGFIVKVSGGTSVDDDDYYLQYSIANESWEEVAEPNSIVRINANTMPHVLYALTDGSGNRKFELGIYQGVTSDGTGLDGVSKWADRKVGNEVTNENPSFIGKAITSIFFHKNRLGFITGDSIILSGTGDYGNFFSQTVQDVLDDDPIDLAVATTDVTLLRHAISTSQSLLLFSDDAQFTLNSLDGALTPNSATISPVSNYTYNPAVKAQAVGNKVYFTSVSGGYAQLYTYKLTDRGAQVTEAIPLTLHVPSYIDKSVYNMVGHDTLGYVFLIDKADPKRVTVLTNTSLGQEDLQNAFHTWEFAYDIYDVFLINNDVYFATQYGLLSIIKLEIPGDIDTIDYTDMDLDGNKTLNYTSYIKFSQFFWRDGNGKGTARGRLQLRTLQYSISDVSRYKTTITNSNLRVLLTDKDFGPTWDNTLDWDDSLNWADINPLYSRIYYDDSKVTVMSDTRYAEIVFSSNDEDAPNKGFELATVNTEMLFHQRSSRV